MIYIIGDSHVSVFSGTDMTETGFRHIQPEFGTCYTLKLGQIRDVINKFEQRVEYFTPIKVGSYTAYNSYDKLPIIEQSIDEYQILYSDYIFLCFGQIDIQNHIVKNAIRNNVTVSNSIVTCVDKYFNTILYLKTKYSNIKIGVYAPPATSIGCGNNPKITKEESKAINDMTLEFNEYLKNKCLENNVIFKDVSKEMLLPNGLTDNKFVMDDIHLSQEIMPYLLKEFKDIYGH